MSEKQPTKVDDVEALLAQTQCQQCDYKGCRPYAEAMVSGQADIDRCLPGGAPVYEALASYFSRQVDPAVSQRLAEQWGRPWVAWIDPQRCVGCYKCVAICPQDAVVGVRGALTTIDQPHCNGCGLCLPVCPMDCIETPAADETDAQRLLEKSVYRSRYQAKERRDADRKANKLEHHQALKRVKDSGQATQKARQEAFLAAIKRRSANEASDD